jgi:hypothetical protein
LFVVVVVVVVFIMLWDRHKNFNGGWQLHPRLRGHYSLSNSDIIYHQILVANRHHEYEEAEKKSRSNDPKSSTRY